MEEVGAGRDRWAAFTLVGLSVPEPCGDQKVGELSREIVVEYNADEILDRHNAVTQGGLAETAGHRPHAKRCGTAQIAAESRADQLLSLPIRLQLIINHEVRHKG
ncbi:hypothetical protein [Arthrobacter sp. HLT1-21]